MNEADFIRILRHYQHDLMNDLQIVQGYLSMEKIDRVKDKVNDFINHTKKQQKLTNINAPAFVLWIIQMNIIHKNIRLTYSVNMGNYDLVALDRFLVEQCQHIIVSILMFADQTELYKIKLQLNESSSSSKLVINLIIKGQLYDIESFKNKVESRQQNSPIIVTETEKGIVCEFSYFV